MGVTGQYRTQLPSLFKEKASLLKKGNTPLLGRDFTDNFRETIKFKKQSTEAIIEVRTYRLFLVVSDLRAETKGSRLEWDC